MRHQLLLSQDPIDQIALLATTSTSPAMGAAIYFVGMVRDREGNDMIRGIEYEAFREMVQRQFEHIFENIDARWPCESVRVVHRLGFVKVNEPSLWVEVIAPHRLEAFLACQFLIDEMKRIVPIWKRPHPLEDPRI